MSVCLLRHVRSPLRVCAVQVFESFWVGRRLIGVFSDLQGSFKFGIHIRNLIHRPGCYFLISTVAVAVTNSRSSSSSSSSGEERDKIPDER